MGGISYAPAIIAQEQSPIQPETWITIFVHGIMSIKPHLSFGNFMRFMTDNVHGTVYSKTVELMRDDIIFHQNQAMQQVGLKKIDPYDVAPGNASSAMALVFEQMSAFANTGLKIENHYYTFGWSGLLSPKQRYADAISMYNAIAKEVASYVAHGVNPKVRIIGYSHGGNVLLNLALARQQSTIAETFTVNELILLGMPVQAETDHLINDPIFETVYHLYSRGDRIQKLDFFSFNRFFSSRLFKNREDFQLPEKLIQIQLKCTRNAKPTITADKQNELYNFANNAILSGTSRLLRDASPGHTELWFFGWTPGNYRNNFPLYPLPAASLIPLILREARNFQHKEWYEKPTLIDIRPEQEVILIRNQKSKKMLTIAQFLPKSELNRLGKQVMQYKPEIYNQELYFGGIQKALQQAQDMHSQKVKKHKMAKKERARHKKKMLKEFNEQSNLAVAIDGLNSK